MTPMDAVIGTNVRRLMQSTGKTYSDLAAVLSVSPQTVNKMLTGNYELTERDLRKIADAFNTKVEDLAAAPPGMKFDQGDTASACLGEAASLEVQRKLEMADELADIICSYAAAAEHAKEEWRELRRKYTGHARGE